MSATFERSGGSEIARALAELRETGVAVVPGVLNPSEAAAARAALLEAAAESERRGVATFMPELDPNAANVRVFNLLDMHEIFRELILHPVATALVRGVLGEFWAISNFTANIARRLMLEEKRIWMGVEALMLDGPLATALNLPYPAGLLVQSVAEGSLGARLGLHEGKLSITVEEQSMLIGGDIVVEIQGQPIRPSAAVLESLQKQLDQLRTGDTLKMKVLRAGRELGLSTRITD